MQDIERSPGSHEPANTEGPVPSARIKPPPPPEVANWVITPTPPEMLKYLRETFDEVEFITALREAESSGGTQIDDLIDELERKIDGGI